MQIMMDLLTLQVEAVQLASKSSTKQMEAELASLKRDAAQAAAAHKQAIASWHSRVDQSEAEVVLPSQKTLFLRRATSL